jgi:hypothetical protein
MTVRRTIDRRRRSGTRPLSNWLHRLSFLVRTYLLTELSTVLGILLPLGSYIVLRRLCQRLNLNVGLGYDLGVRPGLSIPVITNTGSIANFLIEYRRRRKPKHRFVWGVLAGDRGGRWRMRPRSSEAIVKVLGIGSNARRRRLRVEDRLVPLLRMLWRSVVALPIELNFSRVKTESSSAARHPNR